MQGRRSALVWSGWIGYFFEQTGMTCRKLAGRRFQQAYDMVILQNKNGQLGNRLFLFSHFIANAIHHDYRLLNPTFDEYCRYFPATRNDDFGPFPVSVRGRGRLSCAMFERLTYAAMHVAPRSPWHRFFRWRGARPFDLNDATFIGHAKSKAVFVFGWALRDFPHLLEHADTVRRFFTPDVEIMDTVRRVTDAARGGGDVLLIGVHVRRGDYRHCSAGRYCFDNPVYADKMQQAAYLLAGAGQRVRFLVCSDEPIAPADFRGLDVAVGPGSAIGDLYALARCDYLIGPPSTFSLWAAFYGQKPYCWINSADQTIARDQFVYGPMDPVFL